MTITPAWRRIPLNMALALINAYGLSVAGFLLLRALIGESWNLIALFNSIAHLLFLPAILLLPLALLLRRRFTLLLLAPALLAFLVAYGPAFMPRTALAAPDSDTLSVLTYNLKFQAHDLDAALHVIREADADLVALQELSEPMAQQFAVVFADIYPYQALHTRPDQGVVGQGVLSRYPIIEDEYWRIHMAMQRVTVDLNGQTVTLYNAHPMQPISRDGFDRRGEEISDLLARAITETNPVILAGDFNMSDQSADYGRVTMHYQDAYRASGWGLGFTFPVTSPHSGGQAAPSLFRFVPPLVRLDYVFHDNTFTSQEARVWPDAGGSDHLPVFVVLGME